MFILLQLNPQRLRPCFFSVMDRTSASRYEAPTETLCLNRHRTVPVFMYTEIISVETCLTSQIIPKNWRETHWIKHDDTKDH